MEKVTTKKLAIYSGRTHPALADEVATHLGQALGEANVAEFANGEIHCRFSASIRGSDVFIINTHSQWEDGSINDSLIEHLIMVDAATRASAKRITVVARSSGMAVRIGSQLVASRSPPSSSRTCSKLRAPIDW